jgi:lysozyme
MSRSVSPEGLALIKGFEGFRASPAELPDGAWVVGYGHVRIGEAGAPVSEEEASELLALDLAPVERSIAANTFQPLSQAQFDALCSFAFSVGTEAFETSAVLRRLNAGKFVAAACAMDAWRKSDARGELEVIDALIRRRAAEKAMFLSGMPSEAAPSVFVRAKLDYAAAVLGAPVDHKPAPDVAAIPRRQPRPDAGQRLTEILRAEPATEALLLTEIVPDDIEDEDEIVTAHAKPVARMTAHTLPAPRRVIADALANLPRIDFSKFAPRPALANATINAPRLAPPQSAQGQRKRIGRPAETASLGALFMFGAGLVTLGATAVAGSPVDIVDLMGASALAAPGLFAMFLAVYGLMKGPASKNA